MITTRTYITINHTAKVAHKHANRADATSAARQCRVNGDHATVWRLDDAIALGQLTDIAVLESAPTTN